MRPRITVIASACLLLVLTSGAFSMSECVRLTSPPLTLLESYEVFEPYVLSSGGDTTWLQVHTDSTYCPGDPYWGHGGEARGGPGPLETWCFENGPGDTCGTNPPWDTNCFRHVDVRAQPSQTGLNFWHVDAYRADQRPYCGAYALWCGSDSLWTDGFPVECGTWQNPPGYGNSWNCYVQLSLPGDFEVANGCTLLFDPRYDLECKYDYLYVDYWNGSAWRTLAMFNASSNNPGSACGDPGKPNPDFWGNTDTGQPDSADWQERADPDEPAFKGVISADSLALNSAPRFRWRVVTDAAWSDADGRGDTDGAAFIDNVWVWGDSARYGEDFESGVLDPVCWSLLDPEGVIDQWHIVHDPDPPYEGGDGGNRTTCELDSSYVFRGRPEGGYAGGAAWRNGWFYRLVSPTVPLQNSGCVIQWDEFACAMDYTCDYTATRARFHNSAKGGWCPWFGEDYWICGAGCFFWNFDRQEDFSSYYGAGSDSVQFAWDLVDVSTPNDFCRGKHTQTEFIVDNVSIGFFDADATEFRARAIDLLHDSFFENLCAFNSSFSAYSQDTVAKYSGPPYDDVLLPKSEQLYLDVIDDDGLVSVDLYGSLDEGAAWTQVGMAVAEYDHPEHPEWGGEYYGTFCPTDFGMETWATGTEVWYYVKATDLLSHEAYYPKTANPLHPDHTGKARDCLTFSILPMLPDTYTGSKILLVNGYPRRNYDFSPCLSVLEEATQVYKIYERALSDAGYCYDRYDLTGGGSNVHIDPIWYDDYDAVVWFTGPYFSNYLIDKKAQKAIRDFLGGGGKVVLAGDRLAYDMAPTSQGGVGEDSLGGDFLGGILGSDYLGEMPSPFTYPYAYAVGVDTVSVFGTPVEIDLDTILVYRECPYLKDMSYVAVSDSPPAGYTAQRLMYVSDATVGSADPVIYTEYLGVGQCAFIDFDLCACVNAEAAYCAGDAPYSAPDFAAGTYDGRAELLHTILEDLFGLPSSGSGGPARIAGPVPNYRWELGQNVPNPCVGWTEIRYEVGHAARIRLRVYNAMGQVVRVLEDVNREPGLYHACWDGLNAHGERVSSGVYFYQFEAGGFHATRKMLVLR